MKLFKVISSSGELSRRKSIDAIQEAMVTVNGNLVLDPFIDVKEKDDIRLDNKKIKNNIELMTILLNKPQGYISTKTDEKGEGCSAKLWSIDLTGYNERLVETETDASDPSWSSLLSN